MMLLNNIIISSYLHKKNCIHHAYIDDVSLPSEIYSWYLHPSEIGILDNNPLRKTSLLVLTPLENLRECGNKMERSCLSTQKEK